MNDQYSKDIRMFVEIFSEFTGIQKEKLFTYLKDNKINNLIEHPYSISPTIEQLHKIKKLKLLDSLYNNLKINDFGYFINDPQKAGNYLINYFKNCNEKEYFCCVFLDTKNKVITTKKMFSGTVDQTVVYPREIAKEYLLYDANAIITSHNHPSKIVEPSVQDIAFNDNLSDYLGRLNIRLLDNIIVAGNQYYSFAANGLMKNFQKDNISSLNEKGEYTVLKNIKNEKQLGI